MLSDAAVFIRPAVRAHRDGLIDSVGCDVDDEGFVRVDATGRTSVPGVWAAGNAGNPRAQVITAAGEGSAAAIPINADLVEEDLQIEPSTPPYHLRLPSPPRPVATHGNGFAFLSRSAPLLLRPCSARDSQDRLVGRAGEEAWPRCGD
jgi:hypothetical protein